jgi:class 3 adenylate cyclase
MTDLPEVHYARSGGVALAFQVLGSGAIDLVFVPGFISNLDVMWEFPPYARFLQRLASFSRLIVTDRRGTGLSDRLSPDDVPPLEVSMDDLNEILEEVGSDRAALFGCFDSGALCSLFAATYPERTSALALFAPAVLGAATEDFPWAWSQETWDAYMRGLAGWGTLAYAEEVFPRWNPSLAGDRAAIGWWAKFMRQAASPNAVLAIERIWHEIDVRPVLPTIRVPTLVLHRVDDPSMNVMGGREVGRMIPGSRFVALAGRDSYPWAGDQDAVLDEVEEFLTGVRHAPRADRVLATVLFTDIVGSTEKAAAMGDDPWSDLLSRHHERVRAELEGFRGHEIAAAGDGFLATFDGPARAVQCARAIADGVHDLGIEIRAGVHTGEIEIVGEDVRGIAVHIGARVSALARPSEVLVSSTVKDLVAGSGLRFEDAGEHELKGVPDRWRLYRVV